MKTTLLSFFFILLLQSISQAQDSKNSNKDYRNFPLTVTVQFQNLALPFRDLGSNFSHVGISVGTEVSLNGKQNWAQQFQAGFYLNRDAGNGFFTYTQTVYRPTVFKHFYPEVKVGVGWQRVFHPVDAYVYENGNYVSTAGGKSQLIVPLGISIGYNDYSTNTYASPFISYQVIPALSYNDGIPLNFYSLFQVGTRIHFK
ncbi:MAG: hypothetical protein ACHQD9_03615 [Chitinophagales bacterium]